MHTHARTHTHTHTHTAAHAPLRSALTRPVPQSLTAREVIGSSEPPLSVATRRSLGGVGSAAAPPEEAEEEEVHRRSGEARPPRLAAEARPSAVGLAACASRPSRAGEPAPRDSHDGEARTGEAVVAVAAAW